MDRLESGLNDQLSHLATHEGEEDAAHAQERVGTADPAAVIDAERTAVIALRPGDINDETLREIRRLDLEELRMRASGPLARRPEQRVVDSCGVRLSRPAEGAVARPGRQEFRRRPDWVSCSKA